ncbi:MAG: energy-coupling factor transporter ATPase [Clostridia bacterium]|nr:energy-coupling factor transporter ATPase [Clostridia bacterium]
MSYIELKGVSYAYSLGEGRSLKALKNLSLSVEKGSFVALVGKNGSGKSTLAKLFNGLFLPTSGEVFIDGISTADEEKIFEVRKKVGMVFQNPDNQTIATMVEDDVAFGPENIGLPHDEIVERVNWALDAVGMGEYKNRRVSKLSGGQKQRVAIAGVLAMKPDVIIFDESTSMLDPVGRNEVLKIAKELNENGVTVINITHSMEEAVQADRIIVLNKGAIAFDGTPKQVFTVSDFESYGLKMPAFTAIAEDLKKYGYEFDGACVSADELAEGICRSLK